MTEVSTVLVGGGMVNAAGIMLIWIVTAREAADGAVSFFKNRALRTFDVLMFFFSVLFWNSLFSIAAVNGNWGSWGTLSSCSKSCGTAGTMSRRRTCSNPAPRYGGRTCAGDSIKYFQCNRTPCKGKRSKHFLDRLSNSWKIYMSWKTEQFVISHLLTLRHNFLKKIDCLHNLLYYYSPLKNWWYLGNERFLSLGTMALI